MTKNIDPHNCCCFIGTKFALGCPSICIQTVNEVCGSDGRTYSNKCKLSVAACNNPKLNIVEVHKGPCGKDVDDDE